MPQIAVIRLELHEASEAMPAMLPMRSGSNFSPGSTLNCVAADIDERHVPVFAVALNPLAHLRAQ
jgi:hypothetical protein